MTDAWKQAQEGKLPSKLKGGKGKKVEIVKRTPSRVYDEDGWIRFGPVEEITLEMSLVRRRLAAMEDWELHQLIERVKRFADDVKNIPMTDEQRDNSRKLVNGFKSIFVVERQPS